MNGNVYDYSYLPPPPPPPPMSLLHSPSGGHRTEMRWSCWSPGSPSIVQDFSRPPPPINRNFNNNHRMPKPHQFYNLQDSPRHFPQDMPRNYPQDNPRHFPLDGPRHYLPRPPRFNNNHFGPPQQPPWQKNPKWFKRQRQDSESSDSKGKPMKRKRKGAPNSSKKQWTKVDAERALQMEKDYNKKVKNRSLLIKFPDVELNKDIVSNFHPEIKNVHFQQPSTPRYCFVTLKPSVDPEKVIESLKQQKFGDGLLTVEYKKERDDDQVVQPEDIDPFTLYVGNLAQEVTKEDMLKVYPKSRRIDIGYAMKMKYTRYAFVGFKSMEDCIEAFKRTHSMEMRSKSLIVRFRRIHGTVGMPGESKSHNASRNNTERPVQNGKTAITLDEFGNEKVQGQSVPISPASIKEEPKCDEDVDVKPFREDYVSPFMPGSLDAAFAQIRPKVKKEEVQVKREDNVDYGRQIEDVPRTAFKEEPTFCQDSEDDNLYDVGFEECIYHNETDEEEDYEDYDENDEYAPEQVTNFDNLYSNMVNRVNIFNSLREWK